MTTTAELSNEEAATVAEQGVIDIDASRAARREAKGRGPIVRVGGKEYELEPELPFEALEALRVIASAKGKELEKHAPGAVVALTRALLGEHYSAIKSQLSMPDLDVLVAGVMREYGVERPLPSSAS